MDTVLVVSGLLQFQLTTKNEIGNPFGGSLSHFFVGAILQQPPLYNNPALQFGRNAQRFSSSSASPCFTVPLALAVTAA